MAAAKSWAKVQQEAPVFETKQLRRWRELLCKMLLSSRALQASMPLQCGLRRRPRFASIPLAACRSSV